MPIMSAVCEVKSCHSAGASLVRCAPVGPQIRCCCSGSIPGAKQAQMLTVPRTSVGVPTVRSWSTTRALPARPSRSRCCCSAVINKLSGGDGAGGASGSDGRGGNSGGDGNGFQHNSGGGDGSGSRPHKFDLGMALLGAVTLTVAFAAYPAPSKAAPGSLSTSPTTTTNFLGGAGAGGSSAYKSPALSSSAPSRGGFLSGALDRSSLDLPRGSRASSSGLGEGSGSSPPRPRSKVMHVSTKGGTLVVPLPANSEAKAAALPPRMPLWQRAKILEAPIELSEREAQMIAGRQNRVRDSLLV